MDLKILTIGDIESLEMMIKFKNEAKRLYNEIINKQYIKLITDANGRYTVWKDDHNSEYLVNRDGKWWWVAAYLHQHYEVPIDENGIYQIMNRGYEWSINPEKHGYVNNDQDAIKYFTGYINHRLNKN